MNGFCVRGLGIAVLLSAPWSPPMAAHAQSASPIYGVTISDGYRQFGLVAVSHEAEPLNELRAILGNPIALSAYRAGALSTVQESDS